MTYYRVMICTRYKAASWYRKERHVHCTAEKVLKAVLHLKWVEVGSLFKTLFFFWFCRAEEMGKKGNWFSAVKKAFRSPSKDKDIEKSEPKDRDLLGDIPPPVVAVSFISCTLNIFRRISPYLLAFRFTSRSYKMF